MTEQGRRRGGWLSHVLTGDCDLLITDRGRKAYKHKHKQAKRTTTDTDTSTGTDTGTGGAE